MSVPEIGFAIPGDLATRTGGYGYDRRLIAGLRARALAIRHLAWPGGFPAPDAAALAAAANSLAAQPEGRVVLVDGLAFGTMPGIAGREAARLRLVALVHHPLALETDAPSDLRDSECEALRHARAVIATSEATAETLRLHYAVPAARLLVAPPGTDAAPPAPRRGDPPHLLSLGAVTARKGHDVLVAALAKIADLPWRCTIAGSLERAPATVRALRAQIDATGLGARIALLGEVEAVAPLFADADLFVLASRHEGFGMAYAEALAHGLPVIGTLGCAVWSAAARPGTWRRKRRCGPPGVCRDGRPASTASRPCCATWRKASSEIQIEEHVLRDPVAPAGRPHRLAHLGDGRQAQAGEAGPDQHRRDAEMQPVQHAGREKGRDGMAATLDQQPSQATGRQGRDQVSRRDPTIRRGGQAEGGHPGRPLHGRRLDGDAVGSVIGQHSGTRRQPPLRVDHDTDRIAALRLAHRQPRIIHEHRADSHYHCIGQRPQPVEMSDRLAATDGSGMSGRGRNPPVQRLPELAEHEAVGSIGERRVERR
jgi:hypothetical protein